MAREQAGVGTPELYDDTGSELLTGEAVALDLHATGFALRAAGAIIDALVYLGSYAVVVASLIWIALSSGAEEAVFGIITISCLVLCIVVAPIMVETLSHGKSLGKLAVGARIVRDDGGAITFRHSAIRALVGVLEIYMTLGGLAALVGLLNERSKRLGDLLAGTYAQYERVAKMPTPVFAVPMELASWATVADVARMPDQLARRIAQFLSQATKLDASRRPYVAASLLAEARPYVHPVPDGVNPELMLAGIAVVRREREAAALALEAERLKRLEPALRGSGRQIR